jgi:hypothetical protein
MGWKETAAEAATVVQVLGSVASGFGGNPPDQAGQLADWQQSQNEQRMQQFGDSTSMKSSESSRSAEIRRK